MANAIISHFDFGLSRSEEVSLAVCIDIAASLYKKNPHYSHYHQAFTDELRALEAFYRAEINDLGAVPADVINIQSNYDYARIIKNGLDYLGRAHFSVALPFVKTTVDILCSCAIIAELCYKRHPIEHEYFSYMYDCINRFERELNQFLRACESGN